MGGPGMRRRRAGPEAARAESRPVRMHRCRDGRAPGAAGVAAGGRPAFRSRAWLRWVATAAVAFATLAGAVHAGEADDERYRELIREIRCLVCQNQSIADSQAELATDLKREVRAMIEAGRSDEEILAFLTDRYGDFVLYRPPVKSHTVLLWIGPGLLVAIGALVFVRILRARARMPAGELPDFDRPPDEDGPAT